MVNIYDKGDLVRCTGTFTDSETPPNAVDPTTVSFKFKNPAGSVTTYVYGVDAQLVRSGVGIYYADISLTAPGIWRYRFESTGTGQAAGEHFFEARESFF